MQMQVQVQLVKAEQGDGCACSVVVMRKHAGHKVGLRFVHLTGGCWDHVLVDAEQCCGRFVSALAAGMASSFVCVIRV